MIITVKERESERRRASGENKAIWRIIQGQKSRSERRSREVRRGKRKTCLVETRGELWRKVQISLFYEGSKEVLSMNLHHSVYVGCKQIRIFHLTKTFVQIILILQHYTYNITVHQCVQRNKEIIPDQSMSREADTLLVSVNPELVCLIYSWRGKTILDTR